ncbi:MAG TPA: M20/M25/M40 family metallo-hydrolase [Candidatus Saccharimonadales bacterium]|nr:M20/M25/M40 family metallo-hydrolase [Candidatus Saccharimonadales bacterium]
MTYSEKHILDHILKLSKRLIAVPSTLDNLAGLEEVLEIAKKELEGYFAMEEFENNGISSLLIHNTNKRTKHFTVILNAHLDVVPGKKKQFKSFEKDGKLYGRGSYDMKAAAAVMIILFKNFAQKLSYPIAIQLVTDEEIGGYHGAGYQIKKGVSTDFFLMGEPSWLKLNNAAKGVLWIKLTAKGETNHAAYPWLGQNAIIKMHHAIKKLEEIYPTPKTDEWKTTAALTRIETTNKTTNKIPDNCTAYFDIRYIPSDQRIILQTIRDALPEDITVEIITQDHAFHTKEDNVHMQKLAHAVEKTLGEKIEYLSTNGSSDARHYEAIGNNGVCFGPLGEGHHSDKEYVDIKSLENYYHILKDFLFSLSST